MVSNEISVNEPFDVLYRERTFKDRSRIGLLREISLMDQFRTFLMLQIQTTQFTTILF